MLCPGHGMADVIMNAQQLWLPSQDLHTHEIRHDSERGPVRVGGVREGNGVNMFTIYSLHV